MKELIEVIRNEMFVDSRLIAKHFNKKHKNVIQSIDKLECSKEFFGLNFQPRDYIDSRGKNQPHYLITRDGFAFLCMGFTGKKAAEWKEKYIAAFNQMEKRLLNVESNKKDTSWIASRNQGKIARLEETDVIKQFVEYATSQGSKNARHYYSNITRVTYKALGLISQHRPKLRDEMNIYQIAELLLAERIARNSLSRYMESGRRYKDIYQLVVDDLLSFAGSIRIASK